MTREPPDIHALLSVLNEHDVRYLVTGSVAAMLHGVELEPGDLDITPALDHDNLTRLARVLGVIEARQDPQAPFGQWEAGTDGEQRWVPRDPTPQDVAARATWQPDPTDPASFDHLLQSKHGAIDIVPEVSGSYERLRPGAVELDVAGQTVWVEGVQDLLATLTVARREKDSGRVQQLRAKQRPRDVKRAQRMERFRFDSDVAFAPREDLLEGVTVAPLSRSISQGSPVQAAVFRLAPGGRIARHPASCPQILAVLDGSGEVSGADGVDEPIAAGEAVFWPAGEEHETKTAAGLTALIIEGEGLEPFSRPG